MKKAERGFNQVSTILDFAEIVQQSSKRRQIFSPIKNKRRKIKNLSALSIKKEKFQKAEISNL